VVKQPTPLHKQPKKSKKGFGHKNQEKNNGEFIHHHSHGSNPLSLSSLVTLSVTFL
jgi:hypothetical protein